MEYETTYIMCVYVMAKRMHDQNKRKQRNVWVRPYLTRSAIHDPWPLREPNEETGRLRPEPVQKLHPPGGVCVFFLLIFWRVAVDNVGTGSRHYGTTGVSVEGVEDGEERVCG